MPARNSFIPHRQIGFSLLEVIVALAILGICVSVILRIFSSVTSTTQIIGHYSQALQIAETQMALLVAQDSPVGSGTGVELDSYRWHTQVTEFNQQVNHPLFDEQDLFDPEMIYRPYLYQVTVSWGEYKKKKLNLETIRLAVKQ